MTTTTLPVTITCPDWCTETAEHHLAELEEVEGCVHQHLGFKVEDPITGPGFNPIEGDHHAKPIGVWFTTITRMDGTESALPCFYIGDHECSLEQALGVAGAINDLVEQYRATGGCA